jgi:predicted secreted protein
MTEARIGWGTEVWLDNASNVLTQLEECTAIGLPNGEVEDVEATHMLSPNRRREYVAGLIEDGTGDFEFNLVPGDATDLLIEAARNDGVARDYEVIIPDGAFGQKFAGTCIVKNWARDVPIDGVMKATMTVRFTGAVTITTLVS